MKVVVLLSGGMDSVTALYGAQRDHEVVAALSFDYGSKHNAREIPFASHHAAHFGIRHEVVDLGFVDKLFESDLLRSGGEIPDGHYEEGSMKRTVVPFRNGIMLSVAAGYAESANADGVLIAAHTGDHAIYADCREEFMEPMARAVKAGTDLGIEVLRPFIHLNKSEIAALGDRWGVDFSMTWSCYKGREKHCGKCGTCVERVEALERAGIADSTEYE